MNGPPSDPRQHSTPDEPTWLGVLVSYAALVAIPTLLWVVGRPLARTAVLVAVAGLVVGARRAYRLARCFRDCRGFAFDLGGRARITVARTPTDDAN